MNPVQPRTQPPFPVAEVHSDASLALLLAHFGRAHGELIDTLRRRLCTYVHALAPAALAWSAGHPGATEQERHAAIVRKAVALARADGGTDPDPAHSLRLLAKAADTVARMAAAGARTASGEHNGC